MKLISRKSDWLLLTVLILMISCNTQKKITRSYESGTALDLNEILKKHGYSPVKVPRDFDGVKSIISFKNGEEFVVSPPRQCLRDLQIGGGNVQFPSTEIESSFRLNAKAGSEYLKTKNINTNLGFERYKITNVIVRIDSIKVERIYSAELEEFLENNTLSRSCSERLNSDSIYAIIYETVIASHLTYSFVKNDSTKMEITADFLKLLGLSTDNVFTNYEKTTLSFRQPLIIGYKAMKIKDFARSFSGSLRIGTVEKLTVEDIENLIGD